MMKTLILYRIGIVCLAFALVLCPISSYGQEKASPRPVGAPTPPPSGAEWINLLDDEHVGGWKSNVQGAALFEMKDDILHVPGTPSGGFIGYMTERLRDFALHIEFRVASMSNSGVILRGEVENPPYSGFELQILDDCGRFPTLTSCGALYDVVTPMFNMSLPAGEWNSFDIQLKGRVLVVFMNGWKILDVDMAKMTMPIGKFSTPYATLALDGYLFLEDRGGEVSYRNIFLKKL